VNLAGLSEEQLATMRERATPQPVRTANEGNVRPEVIPDAPKTMITNTFPLETVREMVASGNPFFALLDTPSWSFYELPTGHWPMFSKPTELAALLDEIATS
jgi:hypothetical protein